MTTDGYSPTVLDHFEHPRNAGVLDDADAVATKTHPVSDVQIRMMLRVRDGRIDAVRWQTIGCAASIASSSVASEMITGATLDEALALTKERIVETLGGLPRARLHTAALTVDTIRAAIREYQAAAAGGSGVRTSAG